VSSWGWLIFRPPSASKLYSQIERRIHSDDLQVKVAAFNGPIHEYLKRYGGRDDEMTRQVLLWKEEVGVLIAEDDLEKTVAAARKIDESKMDALSDAARVALKAAKAEDEGDLSGAEKIWTQLSRDFPDDPGFWDKLAKRRINEQLRAVRAQLAQLREIFTLMEDLPDQKPKIPEAEKAPFTAVRFEEVGDLFEAYKRWDALKEEMRQQPQKRTEFLLAASKVRELKARLPRVVDETKWRAEVMRTYLDEAEKLRASSKLLRAQVRCRHIMDLYADTSEKDLAAVREEAVRLDEQIQKELGVKPR
jgi:hypothetical protein